MNFLKLKLPPTCTILLFLTMNTDLTPISTLEQIRPRLTQLTYSLAKLENQLLSLSPSTPKSELTPIQNQLNVALQQLDSFARAIAANSEVLDTTTVFPNADFDTNTNLLPNLLRKKLTPEVESWISSASLVDFQNWDIPLHQLLEFTDSQLNTTIFTGYLTQEEIDRGETQPIFNNNNNNNDDGDPNSSTTDESNINLVTRFIYQGLDA